MLTCVWTTRALKRWRALAVAPQGHHKAFTGVWAAVCGWARARRLPSGGRAAGLCRRAVPPPGGRLRGRGPGGGAATRRRATRGAHQQRDALGELVRLGTAVGAADDEAVRLPLVRHELAQHAVDLRRE